LFNSIEYPDKFFYEYLQRVKDENESEFPEIEYIMDRHSVLSGELAGLQEKQLKLTAESEQLRNVFQQYTKDQMNMNLGLGNDIARTLLSLRKRIFLFDSVKVIQPPRFTNTSLF
jgi:hypothetical protein